MKKLTVLFFVVACILFSCTKEKSIEDSNNKNQSALLIKTVTGIGTNDSLVTSFGYDASGRLIMFSTTGGYQNISFNSQTSFIRNDDGIIQQVIIENSQLGSNDIVYALNYSTSDSRYTSAIRTFTASGTQIKDSIAYTYDNTGRIILEEEFFDAGITGGYVQYLKNEYTYDGNGSVIKEMSYLYDPATASYNLSSESSFEYDTKVNPLKLAIEAFFLQAPEMSSAFNTTKKTIKDYIDPTQNDTITTTYTYNQEDKPDKATVTYQRLGVPLTTTYYYQ